MANKPQPPEDLNHLGAGESYLVQDVLGEELGTKAFPAVRDEVQWQTMYHRGGEVPRLVAVQGEVNEDGSFPIYRHPSDQSPPLLPFSPTVSLIRREIEKVIRHPVNHVLIQHYRSGKDYISEHSDKTIDVVRGSSIVNVSLGAQRNMDLKIKKERTSTTDDGEHESRITQRFPLPHNSMFVMGPETNAKYRHAINHDNRPFKLKSPEEQYENGERISLTFRHIGTFLTADQSQIYGQGATAKTREEARPVISGDSPEGKRLLEAFGRENHESTFDWDKWYGGGSDTDCARDQAVPKGSCLVP